MGNDNRKHGTVKWFNNTKGYGFIQSDDREEDLFVHFSYIDMEGYRTLKAGQKVVFSEKDAPKGTHAIDVELIDEMMEDSLTSPILNDTFMSESA